LIAPYFIGIDIGTQGARIVILDSSGEIVESEEKVFQLDESSREEQSAGLWWEICLESLKTLTTRSRDHIDLNDIKAIAVTSTSGTVIPLDKENNPLYNAIMYSDKRSVKQAKIASDAAR
jgi:sugar (pentulose or hexulose) kinase